MSLSLPSDLPDDYTYVSVGKSSFEWRKYTWESAVCKLFAMAIGKMRMCGRTDLQIFERIRVKIMDLY